MLTVCLVDARDLGHERVVRIRIGQQRADGQDHLGRRERGRPLRVENVQADAPVAVHVRMVDLCRERHLGRLEWICVEGKGESREPRRRREGDRGRGPPRARGNNTSCTRSQARKPGQRRSTHATRARAGAAGRAGRAAHRRRRLAAPEGCCCRLPARAWRAQSGGKLMLRKKTPPW